MRSLILLLCAALSFSSASAQAQQPHYGQAELDALLAPVALYPDDVVRLVLDAATAPGEVAEAAKWSRANRGMTGEDAVRAVQEYGWRPSVKAMVAYPDLIERMAESPQWTFDLGNAWVAQQAEVMSTVQALRQRAYASGTLRSDAYQTVQASGEGIAVVPAMPYIYYVPYYDPLVVYGGWWWPAYRPVYWRPWFPRPVFVTNVVVVNRGFRAPVAFARPNPVSREQDAGSAVAPGTRREPAADHAEPGAAGRGPCPTGVSATAPDHATACVRRPPAAIPSRIRRPETARAAPRPVLKYALPL